MSVFQNHVGISLTSSKLNLVEISYSDKNYIVTNIDEEYFEEFLDFNYKETKFVSILQQAFDNILLRNHLNSSFISFSIPSDEFCFFEIPIENSLHREDLEQHLQWEFSVLFPTLKYEDYVFRSFNIEKTENNNSKIITCLPRKIISMLNLFANRNKLQLKYIDNEHFASASAVAYGTNTEDINLLSVNINDNCFSLLLTKNQDPIYFSKKSFSKISEFNSLFDDLVSILISKYNERYPVQKTVLFGNKNNQEIKNLIEQKTNSILLEINPFEFIKTAEKVKVSNLLKTKPYRFAPAIGMAARLF